MSAGDDLWDLVGRSEGTSEAQDAESTMFMVGSSGCGKSTLIQNFLKPNSKKEPKPTFSLEYNFARKKTANGKSLAHIWELGGDIYEPKLLSVPISAKTLQHLSVVICVDLSKPANALMSAKHWIEVVRTAVTASLTELRATNNDQVQVMRKATKALWGDHADASRIQPGPVPIVILATKYDTLKTQGVSITDRRLIFQALRFVAHYYGCSLFSVGGNDAFRTLLGNICFTGGGALKAQLEVSPDKPIAVTAGKDSFNSILGRGGSDDAGSAPTDSPTKARMGMVLDEDPTVKPDGTSWQALADMLEEAFGKADLPPSAVVGGAQGEERDGEESEDQNEYPEPEIDEERAQRRAVLQRYVEEERKKETMLKRMTAASGVDRDRDRERERARDRDRDRGESKGVEAEGDEPRRSRK
jgi:GTPase SAR1 family protein